MYEQVAIPDAPQCLQASPALSGGGPASSSTSGSRPASRRQGQRGIYKGRKPSVPVERGCEMRDNGHGPTAIAKVLGISPMSIHRVRQEWSRRAFTL